MGAFFICRYHIVDLLIFNSSAEEDQWEVSLKKLIDSIVCAGSRYEDKSFYALLHEVLHVLFFGFDIILRVAKDNTVSLYLDKFFVEDTIRKISEASVTCAV